jgi:hypothetical protein
MIETKQQDDIGQRLQDAVLQQAIDAGYASSTDQEKRVGNEKTGGVSPLTGAPTPGGRPKGVKNRLTNLREAVLEAFDTVGGPEYLVRLAQGTQSDRAAFVGLVSKVLPTQINANVEGGIQVQLSWLGQRNIGATTTQIAEPVTQVIDMQRDSAGKYRIIDPIDTPPAGGGQAAADADQGATSQNDAGDAQGA